MDVQPDLLRYEIKNQKPVSAEIYSAGLMAMADEYEQFMTLYQSKAERGTCKLAVGSIRDGSIISDLMPIVAGTIPLLDGIKGVSDFAAYLKALIDWMISSGVRPAVADEQKTLKNISNIVKPTVHDNGAQMNIGTISGGTFNINISLNESQARGVLGFAKSRLGEIKEVLPGQPFEAVLFYWDRASKKLSGNSGDKGRIDDLADYAVSVRFADESIKQKMALDTEFLFKKAYLVDVIVQTIHGGRVALYTISRLIDVIDAPEE